MKPQVTFIFLKMDLSFPQPFFFFFNLKLKGTFQPNTILLLVNFDFWANEGRPKQGSKLLGRC